MVQLSLMEEIKDKTSRLIPTAYMEIVEECTAAYLLIPTYEHVKFLSETVSKKPDAIVDVVRALRRRIADNDVAVKHLTVQLLESMIKNSPTAFHIEVASQKGLLRDLVNVACMQPTTGRAMQAKEAALLLTLNLSIWFRGHPAEECYILTTLADDVRNQLGPNCFEGIEPERNTRVRVPLAAPPARASSHADPRAAGGRSAAGNRPAASRPEKRNIVDAIPIDLPTTERISAMLDVCMTFSEYLNNAEMSAEQPLSRDEVVQSYLSQVRADHQYVTLLLSSNLQLDRDVLRTVSDSQSAVLAKVKQAESQAAARAAAPQSQSAAVPVSAVQHTPLRSAGDTEGHAYQQPHTPQSSGTGLAASHATPPRAEVASGGAFAAALPSTVQAPSVDDLFGDANAGNSISSMNAVEAPQPAVAQSSAGETSVASSVPAPPASPVNLPAPSSSLPTSNAAAAPASAPPPPAEEEEGEQREEAAEQEEEDTAPAGAPAEEAAAQDTEEAAVSEPVAQEMEGEKEKEEVAAPPHAPEAPVPAAPAQAAAAPPKDDDDFDAFLEGRMGN